MAAGQTTWLRPLHSQTTSLHGCSTSGRRAGPTQRGRLVALRVLATSQLTREAGREAVLCQRLKTHEKALTAALILHDDEHKKEFITASLDKSMALWRVNDGGCYGDCDLGVDGAVAEVVRLVPSGSPIFSFVKDGWNLLDNRKQVFCGNMGREILAWEPGDKTVQETVVLDGHCGWVRAMAKYKKWLFSASCSTLRQYDMTRAIPRLVREFTLDKGDILKLATGGDRVFAAVSDGSIRSWAITKMGDLIEPMGRDKAHMDRVTALRCHRGMLYSASYDGAVKMWDASRLELVMEVPKAHEGQRVTCMAVGPNGFLFTGGDDKLIRRWDTEVLEAGEPLYCHNHSLRTLNAGKRDLLISGDSGGEVAVWRI